MVESELDAELGVTIEAQCRIDSSTMASLDKVVEIRADIVIPVGEVRNANHSGGDFVDAALHHLVTAHMELVAKVHEQKRISRIVEAVDGKRDEGEFAARLIRREQCTLLVEDSLINRPVPLFQTAIGPRIFDVQQFPDWG